MKAALLIVLSLSAMAFAGPAFNKDNNQINTNQQQQQQQQQHTGSEASGPAVDILKQWCFNSQMSQQELTASFKKLVGVVKSQPADQATQAAVMSERICQGAMVQKSAQTGQTVGQTGADAQAHELIKDVYMDALISCKSRECSQQLGKIINSNMVDSIRASYYLTRIAVTEKSDIKDEAEIKQMADQFVQQSQQQTSDSIERQKLFATTSLIGKWIQANPSSGATIKPIAEQVVKTIAERYIKPVSEQEVQQYQQQQQQQQQVSQQLAKKIAKRNAALKAMANIPGHILKQCSGVDQMLAALIKNKQELNTVRQSAIECLEQNDQAIDMLKKVALDQAEPIEVRVAAYRALMTSAYAGEQKDDSSKEQVASEILDQFVKHCEQERNQQQDEQFCLYVISHLDNLRTSQQPEHQAIKQCITKNKQHYMQIQVLCKKFKQQLNDVRHSSRNYKLEQEFNQLESGLVLEGDVIYESTDKQQQQQQQINVLPKVIRVNMSMPVMGETVNVLELTMRQNNMDEQILGAVKLIDGAKSFASGSVSKVVDSFKSSVEKQQQQQQQSNNNNNNNQQQATEADLTIKVDGCTIVYLCADDFKTATTGYQQQQHQRNVRSASYNSGSIVDDVIEYLKRQPVAFNRGFNFNINERLAKVLDVEANLIAGLRFESHASGSSKDNFEIVAHMEPRFNFEAIVGPAKVSSKKLLQRLSTKTAIGARLRFKRDELVDIQLDLPMQTMDVFSVESQLVESSSSASSLSSSYKYLPDSIYGQEDIYSSYPNELYTTNTNTNNKLVKRSIFDTNKKSSLGKLFSASAGITSSSYFARTLETPEEVARATGLRAKLRVAVSPKDASFIMSAIVDKYEPSMEGYRVQIQKTGRTGSSSSKQFIVTVSTPGSRLDRTMQIRLAEQSNQQRTSIKAELQSAKLVATINTELIHDGRQYGAKSEIVSRQSRAQWRHSAEAGVLIQGATSGRIASAYKPYVNIESSALKRPIQFQGTVGYQQSPKTVISYELKCQTSGDFFQGKLIVDQARQPSAASQMRKRSSTPFRRSMQSPIELAFQQDLTLTNELLAQVQEHAVKVHTMLDWDASKWAAQADFSASHKNLRQQQAQPTTYSATMKLDTDQQQVSVECKHPVQQERNDFRLNLASQMRGTTGHQMVAELRYNGRRQSVVAYKHQLDAKKIGANKFDCSAQVELAASEYKFNEKMQGRVRLSNERRQKTLDCELTAGQSGQAKLSVDYASLAEHQVQLSIKTQRLGHKCEVRADKRQFYFQSRTDLDNQMVARKVLELSKTRPMECKLVLELPTERTHVAVDLKLAPGKLSSLAIQTPRYVSKGEFSFETVAQASRLPGYLGGAMLKPFTANNLRLKTNLKDLMKKEAYWMDSAVNVADWDKRPSYLRLDSPVYRTDLEFDPREFSAKFGAFARSKRSIGAHDSSSPYTTKESAIASWIGNTFAPTNQRLGLDSGKLWALRSIISSPAAMDSVKQQAKRALFEYADRRQSQRHSFDWSPEDERLSFQLEHQPASATSGAFSSEPMRMSGDLNTSWSRPSRLSLESEWMSADIDAKPFDGAESYAKIGALSRHRRSPFKKHESEYRYTNKDGHKAYMKHQDSDGKRHQVEFQADAKSAKNSAKLAYEADKYGKTSWEHKWRKHASKRSSDQQQVYNNKIAFERQPADTNKWAHKSAFEWEEPVEMVSRRYRRDVATDHYLNSMAASYGPSAMIRRYAPIEYLKRTSARLNSQSSYQPTGAQYNVDFDYQPESSSASLSVGMPDDLVHASSFQMKPSERLYKLQSRLYNARTQQPSYEFAYATKQQPFGLASANQEPVFVHSEHPMLERPISDSLIANLFKQPMKLDYSDKFGRVASLDYDHSPVAMPGAASKYENMRQKRAAVYYKDQAADFEHQSTFDFYPETFLGKLKPAYKRQSGDVALKASTKYGPVVLRTDSSDNTVEMELQSPVVNAKLTGESRQNAVKLIKLYIDNKSQRVELAKLVRQAPVEMIRKSDLVKKFARKMDSARFEHQSELLVSIVDSIIKIKSQTHANQRPVLVIEGELNKQQDKAFVKVNGERVRGQLIADLVSQSAELVLDVDDKRTLEHYARVSRTSDNFYSLQSMASYKSKPVFKMSGKISAMVVEEPEHLFTSGCRAGRNEHLSTFEGVVYEPSEYHVSGQYDCLNKEARVVFKNVDENKLQETVVKFDEQTGDIYVDARLASPNSKQSYTSKAKINLPSLFGDDAQCYGQRSLVAGRKPMIASNYSAGNSCRSELIYSDKSGNWAAKYVPSEYFSLITPNGKQTYSLSF